MCCRSAQFGDRRVVCLSVRLCAVCKQQSGRPADSRARFGTQLIYRGQTFKKCFTYIGNRQYIHLYIINSSIIPHRVTELQLMIFSFGKTNVFVFAKKNKRNKKRKKMKTKRCGVLQRSVVLGVLSFLTNFNTQREIKFFFISCLRTIQRTNICFLLRVGDKEGFLAE